MFYKNARILTSDFKFHVGAFEVKDGRFGAILPENVPEDAIDLNGATVIPGLCEDCLGRLIYFFELSCGISGYVLGVNPFNQPGVEAYKKNMFALLAKPGYEKETEAIKSRL